MKKTIRINIPLYTEIAIYVVTTYNVQYVVLLYFQFVMVRPQAVVRMLFCIFENLRPVNLREWAAERVNITFIHNN